MKFSWSREAVLLLVISLFILIGGYYYGQKLFVQPAKEITDSSSRILANQDELVDQVDALELSEQTLVTELETLNASLPLTNDPSNWLNDVKELADNNNLVVYLFNAVESTGESEINEEIEDVEIQSYQLEVEYERFEELDQFIEDIYIMTQKTDITSISYETGQELSFKATLFLDTYNQSTGLEE